MVAAAVVAATAVVGAVGSAAAGNSAAGAIGRGENQALGYQQSAASQEQALFKPYTDLGTSAVPLYKQLLGLGPDGNAGIMAALQNTPGYQFAQQQGQSGVMNAASATGGLTGATLADLEKYNQGLATETYQNALGNARGAVGIGQASASQQSADIQSGANSMSQIAYGAGQDLAGIQANKIGGITDSVTGALSMFGKFAGM